MRKKQLGFSDWAFEKENRKIDQINKAIERVERAQEKADRKAENKAIARFEKIADREMGIYNRETKRDYW